MQTRLSEIMTTTKETTFSAASAEIEQRVRLPARIQVSGDTLEWSADDGTGRGLRSGRVDKGCLREFARLAAAPPEKFVRFARSYGVLYLEKDGFPVHPDDAPRRVDAEHPPRQEGHPVLETPSVWHQEPLEGWRAWSRYVQAVFVLLHEIRKGERLAVPAERLSKLGIVIPTDRNTHIDDDSPCLERGPDGELGFSDLGDSVYHKLWPRRVCNELERCQTVEAQWDCLVRDVSVRLLRQTEFEVCLGGSWAAPRVALDRPFLERVRADPPVHYALSTIIGQLLATFSGGANTHHCADCLLPYPVQRRREHGRCPECKRRNQRERTQRFREERRAKVALDDNLDDNSG